MGTPKNESISKTLSISHTINLHGPWTRHSEIGAVRVKIPGKLQTTVGLPLERSWNLPSGLTDRQRLLLRIHATLVPRSLSVNSQACRACTAPNDYRRNQKIDIARESNSSGSDFSDAYFFLGSPTDLQPFNKITLEYDSPVAITEVVLIIADPDNDC